MRSLLINNRWSGKLGFIFAAAGAAIGLGNIWRFPYLVHEGGSAFVILYTLFVFLLAMPLLIAEVALGRRSNTNLIDGLKNIAIENHKPSFYSIAGWISLSTLLMILSFYSVISGWVIYYLKESIFELLPSETEAVWSALLTDYQMQFIFSTVFIFLTMSVIAKGVSNGLETLNRILMPCLFLLLIFLVVYSALTTNAFLSTANFLLSFDLNKLTPNIALQALGQALFSLATGGGAMFVYGSYLSKKVSIVESSICVSVMQLIVGILAVFAISPILLVKDLPIEAGPGLIFIAIPNALSGMFLSHVIICLFFILLLFAAITSSINLAEPLVATLVAKTSLDRTKASIVIGVLALLLGIPCILSFNLLKDYSIFGHYTIFEWVVHVSTNILLPIGGIIYAVYATWILPKNESREELSTSSTYYNIWYLSVKYLIPATLLMLLFY